MAYCDFNVHIVFSTKEREPWIGHDVKDRLYPYIGGILRQLEGRLIAAGGSSDHLHLAASLSPRRSLVEVVRTVKANSSKWIHQEFAALADFAWQDGYAVFSVSHSVMPRAVEYVKGQEQHHPKMTFKEELIALFRRHDIKFDERHLA